MLGLLPLLDGNISQSKKAASLGERWTDPTTSQNPNILAIRLGNAISRSQTFFRKVQAQMNRPYLFKNYNISLSHVRDNSYSCGKDKKVKNKRASLECAKSHRHWTIDDWKKVERRIYINFFYMVWTVFDVIVALKEKVQFTAPVTLPTVKLGVSSVLV